MGVNYFRDEQVKELERNPYVKKVSIPFLTVGYVKKGEKCLFKGIFLPFKIVVWEASYEIFLIFLLRSLG